MTATLTGFKTQEKKDVNVRLGEERALDFKMGLETVSETVEVTADAAAVFNPSNTGPVSNVSQEAIQNLPTIGRGLDDFARLNPYFASVAIGGTNTNALSVAGRNNRYNNIQIDGAVNNDLFGLAASGAPGGQADAQPISLDAIQEIQLLVAPYDVRAGRVLGRRHQRDHQERHQRLRGDGRTGSPGTRTSWATAPTTGSSGPSTTTRSGRASAGPSARTRPSSS